MFAEQGNNRNRIKKLSLYALFTAVCIIFGFIESLIPTSFIAPGIKLGLSNSVALLLIVMGDNKGALIVNVLRICLSSLLFGSPFSLLFSLSAGLVSVVVCILLKRVNGISAVGISVFGAVIHNVVQTAVAVFVLNKGVLFYLPILILGGMVSGTVIGFISLTVSKKIKTIGIF